MDLSNDPERVVYFQKKGVPKFVDQAVRALSAASPADPVRCVGANSALVFAVVFGVVWYPYHIPIQPPDGEQETEFPPWTALERAEVGPQWMVQISFESQK